MDAKQVRVWLAEAPLKKRRAFLSQADGSKLEFKISRQYGGFRVRTVKADGTKTKFKAAEGSVLFDDPASFTASGA